MIKEEDIYKIGKLGNLTVYKVRFPSTLLMTFSIVLMQNISS